MAAAVDDPHVVVLPVVEGLVDRRELTAAGRSLFFVDYAGQVFPDDIVGHVWAIDPGSPGVAPVAIEGGGGLLSAAGRLFFTRVDYYNPRRLRVDSSWWTTDGTPEGTRQFDAVTTVSGVVPQLSVLPCDGVTYRVHDLVSGSRLFRTDAAFESHVLLGTAPQGAWHARCVGGRLVLIGSGVNAPEYGFPDAVLQDIGARQFSGGRGTSAEASGFLYVDVSLGVDAGPAAGGHTLLRTDGTDEGTVVLLVSGAGGRPAIDGLVGVAGDVGLFMGGTDDVAYALWATDGTPGNRTMLVPIPDVRGFQPLGSSGGLFYFTLDGGLWRTDGTSDGTAEIFTPFAPEVVRAFVALDDVVYLGLTSAPPDAERPARLWRSDGTASGTVALAVLPGPDVQLARFGDLVFVLSDPAVAPPPPPPPPPPPADPTCADDPVPFACELVALSQSLQCHDGDPSVLRRREARLLARVTNRIVNAGPRGRSRAVRRAEAVLVRLQRRFGARRTVRRLGQACADMLAGRVGDVQQRLGVATVGAP